MRASIFFLGGIVFGLVLIGILNHRCDVLLSEATLIVVDSNLGLLASALVFSADMKDTIGNTGAV